MQCTCGAQLPDDARFCLRCGRPQFEEDITRLGGDVPVPPAPSISQAPPPEKSKIDFSNRQALGVSIAVALLTLFVFTMSSVVAPFAASIILLPLFCFAGFTAARWYMRKTGEPITPQAGARLGFMTALWAFLAVAVICALMAVLVSYPELRDKMISAVNLQGNPAAAEIVKMLDNPRKFILLMLGQLLVDFCLFTFPSMLGGMLSVRFSAKK